jgi:hypothetical protein
MTSSARTALSPVFVVLAAACVLLTGAVAVAGPAAAIEDPRRPSAEVTHGPSCGPAVIRVAVTNGTKAHRVALVFDGIDEQDAAGLAAAERAELTSADIDWGQTVDVSVTVTDADGAVEDPIEFGTYTRPSAEDCAALIPPSAAESSSGTTTPSTSPSTSTSTASTSATELPPSSTAPSVDPSTSASEEAPAPPVTSSGSGLPDTSTPSGSTPTSGDTPSPAAVPAAPEETSTQAGASAASVSPGGVVTVRATGFDPGEPVTVSIVGVDEPLTTVTAAADGSVEAIVQIPRAASLGAATVELVGGISSATAGIDLQVAARSQPVIEPTTSVPVFAAGVGLIGAAGVLGLMAARRSRADRSTMPR